MNFFSLMKQATQKINVMNTSMRPKLFRILVLLVITMIMGVLVIFMVTGTFTAGLREAQRSVDKELSMISENITKQFGEFSVHATQFSKELSASIEKKLMKQGISPAQLKDHPELLEKIIGDEYERALFALEKSKSSGVFIILDATVNPSLKDAENSKAGLYIKNMEPNVISSTSPYMMLLRGPSSIGRENAVTLHPQWKMEFDVSEASYFHHPIEIAEKQNLPLSRLYYWTPSIKFPDTAENMMLCSVPLIDSRGQVFGVCGFDVSAMLFKLSYMPDNSTYQRIFCVFAPYAQNTLDTSKALFSGGYLVRNMTENNQTLTIKKKSTFNSYRQEDGALFSGYHQTIQLYQKDSPFAQEQWAVALVIPDADLSASLSRGNLQMALLFAVLLIIGVVISYFLSKEYLMPFAKIIDIIKSNDFSDVSKTNIVEIDDLMEFLSKHQEKNRTEQQIKKEKEKLPSVVYEEFTKNIKTLSPAERAVFNLYVEGYTAKEITQILCLSINTIKTHNKRIYAKLNVASREELLIYVHMLKEAENQAPQY
ncbi:MAG: response regulator transcription factor [Bacillota bacterium]